MNIIAADDERIVLSSLVSALQEAVPDANIHTFSKTSEVLEFASLVKCDVAFLDIQMRGMTGIELAKRLKEISPTINIIFVTGYSDYAVDAFKLRASGYLMKPVTSDDIKSEIEHLRNSHTSFEDKKIEDKKIEIQTFGNFEVFAHGEPVHFQRSKSKELLAYLVYKRGTGCTLRELAAVLYEDKEYNQSLQSQMQTIISAMIKGLKNLGYENIVIKKYNNLSIDTEKVSCDYYRFLDWNTDAINSYTGQFMENYIWAEFTLGYLDSKWQESLNN